MHSELTEEIEGEESTSLARRKDNLEEVRLISLGTYTPDKVLTNKDLEEMVDTSDEWIKSRTGIEYRHLLGEDQNPSDMGVRASRRALEGSPIEGPDLDLIIVATNVSDFPIPGSAPFLAQSICPDSDVPFFDLKAGCSGFIYGIDMGLACLAGGSYENILVVGLEALSRVIDWEDRKTCVLFGDGAGAAVLRAGPSADGGRVLASKIHGNSNKAGLLRVEAGGTRLPADGDWNRENYYLQMEGKGVFKSAVKMMEQASREVLANTGLSVQDLDLIVPHQANVRIIKQLGRNLGVKMDKVMVNLDRFANTSTATVPLALEEAMAKGRIEKGDLVLLTAFGAGATYGATLLEF